MTTTPVLICIDVEPDAREIDVDARADWVGFEESFPLFDEFRTRAERAAGVPARFNWFLRMDPQVALVYGSAGWVAERYGARLERLRGAGDEIGLHTHAWRRAGDRWVTDHGDQSWVEHCVRLSFEAYERAFGRPCSSFRFGDHWMNDETLELVERLGARYELTLEPGLRAASGSPNGEAYTGAFPDCTRVPRAPYRPSRSDFRRPSAGEGARDIWAIPISTTLMPHWPEAPLLRRALWRVRYGRRDYTHLSLALDPRHFRRSVGDVLEGGAARYLCVVMRTDTAARGEAAACLRANIEFLLTLLAAGRVKLTTPQDLAAGLS